jgi:hypothetical protein
MFSGYVNAEVVPLDDVAGDAGDDSAALSANSLLIHPSLAKSTRSFWFVIPAEAGSQGRLWTPAFAGATRPDAMLFGIL